MYKEGFIRVDINPKCNPNIRQDLTEPIWLLPHNYFDVVECDHFIEHLTDAEFFFRKIVDIAKNGASFKFNLPHYTHPWSSPDHKRAYGLNLLAFHSEYKVQNVRLGWMTDINNKQYIIRILNQMVNSFVNFRPYFFERFGYIVGGYMNMTIEGVIKK